MSRFATGRGLLAELIVLAIIAPAAWAQSQPGVSTTITAAPEGALRPAWHRFTRLPVSVVHQPWADPGE